MADNMDQNKQPLITVGMVFFNTEKPMADAIKSVLMQTYSDFELIMIDDGSSDNSYAVAEQFSKLDSRIKLMPKEGGNKGVGYRLNQITDLAKGEYIVRMDADDIMLPEKIEKQMEVLLADESIELIDCPAVYVIDVDSTPVGKRKINDISDLTLAKILKCRTVFFHPTVIAKTSWYKKNRYNEDFKRGPDFELWCRIFGNTKYARLEEPLFIYREGRVSIRNYKISSESYRRSLRLHYKNNLSRFELQKEILNSYLRTYLYQFFGFFGLQHLLTATRNLKLNQFEKERISACIQLVNEFNPKEEVRKGVGTAS